MGNAYSQLKAAINARRKSQVVNPKVKSPSEGWSEKGGKKKGGGAWSTSKEKIPLQEGGLQGGRGSGGEGSGKEPNAAFSGPRGQSSGTLGSARDWQGDGGASDAELITPRSDPRLTPRTDEPEAQGSWREQAGGRGGMGTPPTRNGSGVPSDDGMASPDGHRSGSEKGTPRMDPLPAGAPMVVNVAEARASPRSEAMETTGGGVMVPRPPAEPKQPANGAPAFSIPPPRMHHYGPAMPKRWKKGDSIGAGSFGNVFLGLNSDTGELLAVKEVAVNSDQGKMTESIQQLESEVALLSRLNNPHIVRYVGTLREDKKLYIFLEYVPGGSIQSLLTRFGKFDESVIRVYTKQILLGLKYLHDQRTVHRDIKGANILVEKSGRIKLADFGMAKTLAEHMSYARSFKGSAYWMAPEVIRQKGHGVAADIWSVGCTVLEMATGQPPWSQCSTQVQAIFKIASSGDLPAIPEKLSPEATEFILLCLQRDPGARPTADTLLGHKFVKDVDIEGSAAGGADEYGGGALRAPPGGGGVPGTVWDGGGGAAGGHTNGGGAPPPHEGLISQGGGGSGAGAVSKGLLGGGGGLGSPLGAIGEDDGGAGGGVLPPGSARGGGGAGGLERESSDMLEDSLDFDEEPQHFRVRGLLGLPSLQPPLPNGGKAADLPPLDLRGKGS